MLTICRRDRTGCKSTLRTAKCSCPIWVQGKVPGETVRRSLDLTNWEAAQRKLKEWELHGIRVSLTPFLVGEWASEVGSVGLASDG
jgi:hypothetical protein